MESASRVSVHPSPTSIHRIISYTRGQRDERAVESDAARGLLAATNASEVYHLVARFEGPPGGDDDFDSLPVTVDVERFRDHDV